MLIKNRTDLLEISDEVVRKLRDTTLKILQVGLDSINTSNLITSYIKFDKDAKILDLGKKYDLNKFQRIYVIGSGKASGGMASQVEKILGVNNIDSGLVIVPRNVGDTVNVNKIQIIESEHPIPTDLNIEASRQLLELIKSIPKENSIFFALISGGGSVLLTLPPEGIKLKDIQILTDLLLKSGADIKEINTIRKHCDQFKGGLLAKKLYPATIFTYLISDVINYPPEFIASGPTFPDQTTYKDSLDILRKYNLLEKVPKPILTYFNKGISGEIEETPKRGEKYFLNVENKVIGSLKTICNAIEEYAKTQDIIPYSYPKFIEGEAKEVGKELLEFAKKIYSKTSKTKQNILIIAGGETTVTVKGSGKGGRCQELIAGSMGVLESFDKAVMVAIGTDGIDGNSDAAGAIIDTNSNSIAKKMGLNLEDYLKNNDTYTFFKNLGYNLIFTGPTGTNVSDIVLILL